MNDRVVGVDVGQHGAIALLTASGDLLDVVDLPVLLEGENPRPTIQPARLADILRLWRPTVAYVELVTSRPSDGHRSAFSFGRCRGHVEAVLGTLGIAIESLPPAMWKRLMGIGPGKDKKDLARTMASTRWPNFADRFARKLDADRAEAALVGLAGLQLAGG